MAFSRIVDEDADSQGFSIKVLLTLAVRVVVADHRCRRIWQRALGRDVGHVASPGLARPSRAHEYWLQ